MQQHASRLQHQQHLAQPRSATQQGSIMKKTFVSLIAGLCLAAALVTSAAAQSGDSKDKPRLYTYVSNWAIPRARWDDMEKGRPAAQKTLDQAVASGTILGYGNQEVVVHQADGVTHIGWWIANSMAGVLNALDQVHKAGGATSPVLASATKHWDDIFVSRYYGWKPGTVKDGYVHGAVYKLKADAPNDAVDVLSKGLIVPVLEKLQADGAVSAWQVAEQSVHTLDPALFFVFYISPTAEGLDKVNAAIGQAIGANSLASPAFSSMVDFADHRDELSRGDSVLK
jgi:hypothetical protein